MGPSPSSSISAGEEVVFSSGTNRGHGGINRKVPGMVSYLHLQTLAESADPVGVLIGSVKMQAEH